MTALADAASAPLLVRQLGRRPYLPTWQAMRAHSDARDAASGDELWVVEHPPVFTLGLNGRPEHLLAPGDIPVVHCDRGGQVTYHGPGQVVVYLLLDVRRAALGVRRLVTLMEEAVIATLAERGIDAAARADAPGVYVRGRKIASLGLRIRGGHSYHGLALNVDMELEPFRRINPCGHAGLEVTQMRDLGLDDTPATAAQSLVQHLANALGHPHPRYTSVAAAAFQEPSNVG